MTRLSSHSLSFGIFVRVFHQFLAGSRKAGTETEVSFLRGQGLRCRSSGGSVFHLVSENEVLSNISEVALRERGCRVSILSAPFGAFRIQAIFGASWALGVIGVVRRPFSPSSMPW